MSINLEFANFQTNSDAKLSKKTRLPQSELLSVFNVPNNSLTIEKLSWTVLCKLSSFTD